jgi:hypothetical protein
MKTSSGGLFSKPKGILVLYTVSFIYLTLEGPSASIDAFGISNVHHVYNNCGKITIFSDIYSFGRKFMTEACDFLTTCYKLTFEPCIPRRTRCVN